MDKYFRVFKFMGQVLGMITESPALVVPFILNIVIATPINLVLVVAMVVAGDSVPQLQYILAFVGVTALYFTDYFSAGLASSLIFDKVTTGQAKMSDALVRTGKASLGIMMFASVSAFFDLLATYAQERDDILGSILAGIVRALWTTATYVVMPSMVIEGIGFFPAFKRSKDLATNDPTGVGSGIIGMGLASYLISIGTVGVGGFLYNTIGGPVGLLIFLTLTNLGWALSGYLKITYFTCFYLWARECYSRQSADPRWAPAPLAAALA